MGRQVKRQAEKKGRGSRSGPFWVQKVVRQPGCTVELYPRAQGKVKSVLSETIIMG